MFQFGFGEMKLTLGKVVRLSWWWRWVAALTPENSVQNLATQFAFVDPNLILN
jgi:hypothetical protein